MARRSAKAGRGGFIALIGLDATRRCSGRAADTTLVVNLVPAYAAAFRCTNGARWADEDLGVSTERAEVVGVEARTASVSRLVSLASTASCPFS